MREVIQTIVALAASQLVALLALDMGLSLRWSDLQREVRNPVLWRTFAVAFLGVPLLAILVAATLPLGPAARGVIVLMAVSPGAPMLMNKAHKSGNVALAVTLAVVLTLGALVFVPVEISGPQPAVSVAVAGVLGGTAAQAPPEAAPPARARAHRPPRMASRCERARAVRPQALPACAPHRGHRRAGRELVRRRANEPLGVARHADRHARRRAPRRRRRGAQSSGPRDGGLRRRPGEPRDRDDRVRPELPRAPRGPHRPCVCHLARGPRPPLRRRVVQTSGRPRQAGGFSLKEA